jgi:hypothetical protein
MEASKSCVLSAMTNLSISPTLTLSFFNHQTVPPGASFQGFNPAPRQTTVPIVEPVGHARTKVDMDPRARIDSNLARVQRAEHRLLVYQPDALL